MLQNKNRYIYDFMCLIMVDPSKEKILNIVKIHNIETVDQTVGTDMVFKSVHKYLQDHLQNAVMQLSKSRYIIYDSGSKYTSIYFAITFVLIASLPQWIVNKHHIKITT